MSMNQTPLDTTKSRSIKQNNGIREQSQMMFQQSYSLDGRKYNSFTSPKKSKMTNTFDKSPNLPHYVTPMPFRKQSTDKSSSRSHLANVRVLQKKAILISGLPKHEFLTTKAIEKEFKKYGIITNCLNNPKGISGSRASVSSEGEGTVYVKYLHEKAATNAVFAINGQTWGNDKSVRLQACFVNNRYCNEFLNGRYCQDLNCILLHEKIKDEKKRTNSAPIKPSRYQNYWTTPNVCLGSSNRIKAIENQEKDFRFEANSYNQSLKQSNSYHRSDHGSITYMNESIMGKNLNGNHDCQFTVITPPNEHGVDSETSTPLINRDHNQNVQSTNKTVDILSVTRCKNSKERSIAVDLPARQLFKNNKVSTYSNVIAPPRAHCETERCQRSIGIDSPWGIQSPIMIEKDNFDVQTPRTTVVSLDTDYSLRNKKHLVDDNEIINPPTIQKLNIKDINLPTNYPQQRPNQGYSFHPPQIFGRESMPTYYHPQFMHQNYCQSDNKFPIQQYPNNHYYDNRRYMFNGNPCNFENHYPYNSYYFPNIRYH